MKYHYNNIPFDPKTNSTSKILTNSGSNHLNSTGANFNKFFHYHKNSQKTVELNIWDVSGHDRFNGLCQRVLTLNQFVILCYDSSAESMESIRSWWAELRRKKGIYIYILFTKSDKIKPEVRKELEKLEEEKDSTRDINSGSEDQNVEPPEIIKFAKTEELPIIGYFTIYNKLQTVESIIEKLCDLSINRV
eukprot:TRINITY_DN5789_c0_g1_i2.p1 TRINITY_DN5789_c0_g1~~TRINITY_DN5789_c0_g1_i2.p1  ORF type:complete len:191 (-),score=17.71 TRINITY_DN5789_c0_g1_i2:429-1001(-)